MSILSSMLSMLIVIITTILFLSSSSSLIYAQTIQGVQCGQPNPTPELTVTNRNQPDTILVIENIVNASCELEIKDSIFHSIRFNESVRGGFIEISNVTCVTNSSSCISFPRKPSLNDVTTLAEMSHVIFDNIKMLPTFFAGNNSLAEADFALIDLDFWTVADFVSSTSVADEFRVSNCIIKTEFTAGVAKAGKPIRFTLFTSSFSVRHFRSIQQLTIRDNVIDVNFVSCESTYGACGATLFSLPKIDRVHTLKISNNTVTSHLKTTKSPMYSKLGSFSSTISGVSSFILEKMSLDVEIRDILDSDGGEGLSFGLGFMFDGNIYVEDELVIRDISVHFKLEDPPKRYMIPRIYFMYLNEDENFEIDVANPSNREMLLQNNSLRVESLPTAIFENGHWQKISASLIRMHGSMGTMGVVSGMTMRFKQNSLTVSPFTVEQKIDLSHLMVQSVWQGASYVFEESKIEVLENNNNPLTSGGNNGLLQQYPPGTDLPSKARITDDGIAVGIFLTHHTRFRNMNTFSFKNCSVSVTNATADKEVFVSIFDTHHVSRDVVRSGISGMNILEFDDCQVRADYAQSLLHRTRVSVFNRPLASENDYELGQHDIFVAFENVNLLSLQRCRVEARVVSADGENSHVQIASLGGWTQNVSTIRFSDNQVTLLPGSALQIPSLTTSKQKYPLLLVTILQISLSKLGDAHTNPDDLRFRNVNTILIENNQVSASDFTSTTREGTIECSMLTTTGQGGDGDDAARIPLINVTEITLQSNTLTVRKDHLANASTLFVAVARLNEMEQGTKTLVLQSNNIDYRHDIYGDEVSIEFQTGGSRKIRVLELMMISSSSTIITPLETFQVNSNVLSAEISSKIYGLEKIEVSVAITDVISEKISVNQNRISFYVDERLGTASTSTPLTEFSADFLYLFNTELLPTSLRPTVVHELLENKLLVDDDSSSASSTLSLSCQPKTHGCFLFRQGDETNVVSGTALIRETEISSQIHNFTMIGIVELGASRAMQFQINKTVAGFSETNEIWGVPPGQTLVSWTLIDATMFFECNRWPAVVYDRFETFFTSSTSGGSGNALTVSPRQDCFTTTTTTTTSTTSTTTSVTTSTTTSTMMATTTSTDMVNQSTTTSASENQTQQTSSSSSSSPPPPPTSTSTSTVVSPPPPQKTPTRKLTLSLTHPPSKTHEDSRSPSLSSSVNQTLSPSETIHIYEERKILSQTAAQMTTSATVAVAGSLASMPGEAVLGARIVVSLSLLGGCSNPHRKRDGKNVYLYEPLDFPFSIIPSWDLTTSSSSSTERPEAGGYLKAALMSHFLVFLLLVLISLGIGFKNKRALEKNRLSPYYITPLDKARRTAQKVNLDDLDALLLVNNDGKKNRRIKKHILGSENEKSNSTSTDQKPKLSILSAAPFISLPLRYLMCAVPFFGSVTGNLLSANLNVVDDSVDDETASSLENNNTHMIAAGAAWLAFLCLIILGCTIYLIWLVQTTPGKPLTIESSLFWKKPLPSFSSSIAKGSRSFLSSSIGRFTVIGNLCWTQPRKTMRNLEAPLDELADNIGPIQHFGPVLTKLRGPQMIMMSDDDKQKQKLKNNNRNIGINNNNKNKNNDGIIIQHGIRNTYSPFLHIFAFTLTLIDCVLQGKALADPSFCNAARSTIFASSIISLIVLVTLRPHIVPLQFFINIVLEVWGVVVGLLALPGVLDPERNSIEAAIDACSYISTTLIIVACGIQGMKFIMFFFAGGKPRLLSADAVKKHEKLKKKKELEEQRMEDNDGEHEQAEIMMSEVLLKSPTSFSASSNSNNNKNPPDFSKKKQHEQSANKSRSDDKKKEEQDRNRIAKKSSSRSRRTAGDVDNLLEAPQEMKTKSRLDPHYH